MLSILSHFEHPNLFLRTTPSRVASISLLPVDNGPEGEFCGAVVIVTLSSFLSCAPVSCRPVELGCIAPFLFHRWDYPQKSER